MKETEIIEKTFSRLGDFKFEQKFDRNKYQTNSYECCKFGFQDGMIECAKLIFNQLSNTERKNLLKTINIALDNANC